MSDQKTTGCLVCGRAQECSLCALLAYGYGPTPTPDQAAAIDAYLRRDRAEGTRGPAYERMVAAGLPQWGEAHHD